MAARPGRGPGRRRGARSLAVALPPPDRRAARASAAALAPHGAVPHAAHDVPGGRLRMDLGGGRPARRGPGAALARLTRLQRGAAVVRELADPPLGKGLSNIDAPTRRCIVT